MREEVEQGQKLDGTWFLEPQGRYQDRCKALVTCFSAWSDCKPHLQFSFHISDLCEFVVVFADYVFKLA